MPALLLGSPSQGTATDFIIAGSTAAFDFVAGASGVLAKIWVHTKVTTNAGDTVKVGIYADDGTGTPGSILGTPVSVVVPPGLVAFSADVSASATSIVSGTTYHLAIRDATAQFDWLGTNIAVSYLEQTGTDFSDPWPALGSGIGSRSLEIWGESADGLIPFTPVAAPMKVSR